MANQVTTLRMGEKFKRTPLGNVPVDWRVQPLGELAEILIGGTPSRNKPEYWDSKQQTRNHWVSIADMRGRHIIGTKERISELGVAKSNVKRIPAGTVLMSFKLTIGRAAIAGVDLFTNEAIAAFIPGPELDATFLYYAAPMVAGAQEADVAVKGRTLNKAKLRTMLMAVPPLREQKKIAAILSELDDALRISRETIQSIESLNRAIRRHFLFRGIGLSAFQNTPIGPIPSHWSYAALGDIFEVKSGSTPSRSKQEYFVGGRIPWVKTMDLNNWIVSKTDETITELGLKESACSIFPRGSVLIAMYGGFQQIGRTGVLAMEAATNQAISVLIPNQKADPDYVNCVLIALRDQWRRIASSSRKDPNITKDDVRRFKIPLPPLEEQLRISRIVRKCFEQVAGEQAVHENLTRLRLGLMEVLLSGKLRV